MGEAAEDPGLEQGEARQWVWDGGARGRGLGGKIRDSKMFATGTSLGLLSFLNFDDLGNLLFAWRCHYKQQLIRDMF